MLRAFTCTWRISAVSAIAALAATAGSTQLLGEVVVKTLASSGNPARIVISNTSGEIQIANGGGGIREVSLKASLAEWDKACKLVAEEGAVVRIAVEAPWTSFGKECRANLDIVVPADAQLEIANGSGSINLDRLRAASVDFKVGSGDLSAHDMRLARFSGRIGSGQVRFAGESATTDISSGSGSVSLDFSAVPESGTLNVKSGSGDVVVIVPANAKFASDVKSGSGKVKIEVAPLPKAKFRIGLKSGSGDVKIRTL